MKSASLSVFDPVLVDSLRDQIAADFSARIFESIPEVSDCLEFEAEASEDPAETQQFERTSKRLFSRRREFQSQIAASLVGKFDEVLVDLLAGEQRSHHLSLENMTLMADDRLDEEIAVSHCSRRLKEQCEYELWCLTGRIAVLAGVSHPADAQNPVFPRTFAQALMDAIDTLEADAAVRLVVFKTFGPALLEIVPAVYAAANKVLIARGIELEGADYYGRPVVSPERHSATHESAAAGELDAANVNRLLASALTQILERSSSSLPVIRGDAADRENAALLKTNVQQAVRQLDEKTLAALRNELDELNERNGAMPGVPAPGRTLHEARLLLHDKLTRDEQAVGDIVTVMFDRLSADARMPQQLRPVVAKLQIPVLTLALADRSMLTRVDHPVRKLLDLIAEVGLTLGTNRSDDSIPRMVEHIVDALAKVRHHEPVAFKHAFEQLDDLFYHHEEAALELDGDLRRLEQRESITFAGTQADREIGMRVQNVLLPEAINKFIFVAWREVLIHAHITGGMSGDQWILALAALDNIVVILNRATGQDERRRLVKFLPDMVSLLLNSLGDGERHDVLAANFLAELDRVVELADQGRWDEVGGERAALSPEVLAASADSISPSVALAAMGLACGDWIETHDFGGIRRWRLNWITPIFGTCVFKHYESTTTRIMSCDELHERLATGELERVRGLGLADDVFNGAFEAVSRKLRRQSSVAAMSVPTAANRSASAAGIASRWGASPAAKTHGPGHSRLQ